MSLRLAPSPKSSRSRSARATRNPASGAIETTGLLVALATAAATFGLGMLVLPPIAPEEAPIVDSSPPPAPTPPPAPPPPPAPSEADASASDAATTLAAELPTATPPSVAEAEPNPTAAKPSASAPKTEAPPAPVEPAEAKAANAAKAAKAEFPAPKVESPDPAESPRAKPADTKLADKDLAREAWRKNLPDITTEPGKAAMLIPIRGSIEGAVFHVTSKPRSVLVTLPKAESMITMEFYGPKRDGFRQLWIKKDDSGTTLRIVLGEATDPQVEIKDEFVRVTVRRPAESPADASPPKAAVAAPEPAAPDAPVKAPAPAPVKTPAPAHD